MDRNPHYDSSLEEIQSFYWKCFICGSATIDIIEIDK